MIEVRPTATNELRRAADVLSTSLLAAPPTDEIWERRGGTWSEMSSLSAWEGDRCVGHAGQFPVDTVVPGGARVPTAAVTRIGVLPTHRRRGVASRLVRQLIADSVDAGHTLMSLRASETRIYGRFGFGIAGEAANFDVDAIRTKPLSVPPAPGSIELVAPDRVLDVVPPIYDRAIRRPGAITRPNESWWRRALSLVLDDDGKAAFVAVHRDDAGHADGVVLYEVGWNDDEPDEAPAGRGEVHLLFGVDDATELELWRFVLDVDLVTRWRANVRPLDDPLRRAADDVRAVRVRAVDDEQWLRIVDVAGALAARSYGAAAGSVVISVTDDDVGRNRGSWRVGAGNVEPTHDRADLAVDIATLSELYIGGPSWTALAGLGRVQAADPAALTTADILFATPSAPYCGTFF